MSVEQVRIDLVGDNPGRITELNYYRLGPAQADKKVYLQAALHADEQPGILTLHHLLSLLRAADEANLLRAQFVLFPMVNPLGMGDIEFQRHQGRYSRATGVNYNRAWPELYPAVTADLLAELDDDAEANVMRVRRALRSWVEQMPRQTVVDEWRYALYAEACDADYVFDLHCDDDSLLHIFSVPQMADAMHRLAEWMGAKATMLAEDSGGGSFDEIWPAIWLRLAREQVGKPVPLPVLSCTLELRGTFDTFDDINRADAENLYGYFHEQGLIGGDSLGVRQSALPPTDLRATQYLRAPAAGLLIYCVELGQRVNKGDTVAHLLRLHGESAFMEREPIIADTDGIVLSRMTTKYVWRNSHVAKIVGDEILESRDKFLLSD